MSGFLFSYYRPWEDNSNLVSSWLDYAKDQSRARMIGLQVSKQTGLEVGKYVIAATGMQIQSMNRAVTILGAKFDVLFDIQEKINSLLERSIEQLSFLNRRMDLQIEQQRFVFYCVKDYYIYHTLLLHLDFHKFYNKLIFFLHP